MRIAVFIQSYAIQNNIEITRSTTDLIGEYRLHAIFANAGYRYDQTNNADLEYIADRRWYVNLLSRIIGTLGI